MSTLSDALTVQLVTENDVCGEDTFLPIYK
jgi:hypothetical protein